MSRIDMPGSTSPFVAALGGETRDRMLGAPCRWPLPCSNLRREPRISSRTPTPRRRAGEHRNNVPKHSVAFPARTESVGTKGTCRRRLPPIRGSRRRVRARRPLGVPLLGRTATCHWRDELTRESDRDPMSVSRLPRVERDPVGLPLTASTAREHVRVPSPSGPPRAGRTHERRSQPPDERHGKRDLRRRYGVGAE